MNILPKKRWHVRTKDNIARVRRDEAEAREKEEIKKKKLEFAENEARINFLRKKSGLEPEVFKNTSEADNNASSSSQHIDLFSNYESHVTNTNKETEKEKKEEREKYEKQIGYLTYLGQDTNEVLKLKSWYETAPKRTVGTKYEEKDLKNKSYQDPLTLIKTLLPTEKQPDETSKSKKSTQLQIKPEFSTKDLEFTRKSKKSKEKKEKKSKKKKHKKKSKYDSEKKSKHKNREELSIDRMQHKKEMLEKLREERLRREAAEKLRQEALMAPKPDVPPVNTAKPSINTRIVQKYNSQFNPELAKQNVLENT